jgi:hypothetical protein
MSITPFNSVGGYSTGLTGYTVIDAVGGVSAAGGTFSALTRFTAGISASGGITLVGNLNQTSGGIISSSGFTFGSPSGTTFISYTPLPASSFGGVWMRDGIFQIGGSAFNGVGALGFNPNTERLTVFGYSDINNSYDYQNGRSPLRLNAAPTQSVPILAAYKQTSSGTQLESGFTATNMVAGIDENGALFSVSGISTSGATFSDLVSFTGGMSGNGMTLSGNLSAATKSFVIPHPTKPQMTLQHGSLEGPENGVYVRGRLRGNDTITLPEYWRGLVHEDSITANLTEIGDRNHHWVAYMGDYTITVASERGSVDCFYTVWGERKDVGKLPVEY